MLACWRLRSAQPLSHWVHGEWKLHRYYTTQFALVSPPCHPLPFPPAAANALTMGGASMMGQPLKVELATEAKKAADAALAVRRCRSCCCCCYRWPCQHVLRV